MCSKCENFESDNAKLLKDVESLTLEIKNMKHEKKSNEKQIHEIHENFENLKFENVKLLSGLNNLTLENKVLKEK
ncbi:hypothetical protein Hdeb2414_s0019g00542151 [Helianthus debilis subsp. tardiflorus]